MNSPTVAEALRNVFGADEAPVRNATDSAHFVRVRDALRHGQNDDQLLSGRFYNERYWRSAKASLSVIARELDAVTRERDALQAVVEARP